jgi:hypothetical protein
MRRIIFLILAVLYIPLRLDASGEEVRPPQDPVIAVRDEVLSYFPPVKGVVKEVNDGYVGVYIEQGIELKKGTRLSVFREGRPFYHPVTKKPLGRIETPVGRIEVVERKAGLYVCSRIRGDIRVGDLVRITSSRIKIAFFQQREAEWAISEDFYDSLKESGRFEILEAYTKTYEPERLAEIARELGAEAMLILTTPLEGGMRFINVNLYWVEDVRLFARLRGPVSEEALEASMPGRGLFAFSPVDTEPWGSYDIGSGELIAAGDVDGNGSDELIVSDGTNIKIYSFRDEPRELWSIDGRAGERHLSIDALDMNDNGRAEIFVTSIKGMEGMITSDESSFNPAGLGSVSSFIIEYIPGEGYRRIKKEIPYFFRVVNGRLLMQGFNMTGIFSGPVYEARWEDGEYRPDKPLRLPEGIDIYGFTYIDWGNSGEGYLLSFDTDGYLNLYRAGERVWRSKESFGRSPLTFEQPTHSIVNPVRKWSVKGRLITIRTERGEECIVIKKNPVLSNVPGLGYSGFSVYSLWWDGDVMESRLIMGDLPGTPTDYLLDGDELFIVAHGGLFSFVKKAISGEFSRGTKLYYYKFIER